MSRSPQDFAEVQLPGSKQQRTINVLVVSSVALAFISFWRAAAIVLCDLASTAYYIGGISEQAIGKAAPWFILGVMLFSYGVRAVYVESCTMFTRGGVYRVVKEAMGGTLAKLSVSALMFDYALTGPISAVSAGQYLVGLGIDLLNLLGSHTPHHFIISRDSASVMEVSAILSMLIAIGITLYFWRANLIGIQESSDKALKIMKLTSIMGLLIIIWSAVTLWFKPPGTLHAPPLAPVFTEESLGWMAGVRIFGLLGIVVAFGHSLLAMSGEESLAQVNREIEHPKLKNLLRTGFVIFLFSLLLTSLISFLAVMIIPDGKRVATFIVPNGQTHKSDDKHPAPCPQVDYLRKGENTGEYWGYALKDPAADQPQLATGDDGKPIVLSVKPNDNQHIERDDGQYRDNLINGLAHYLMGPAWAKVMLQAFVTFVGFLILAGAVNTSMVGSNGVLNRLAEDGVLTPWFLHPQKRFGTTHRLINLIAILQLITIVASWGDVYTLGEAYAFGVIWSFVFGTLAMMVLRFRDRSVRLYKVPLNIRIKFPARWLPAPAPVVVPMVSGGGDAAAESTAALSASAQTSAQASTHAPDQTSALAPAQAAVQVPTGTREIDLPIGIMMIFLILLCTAMVNLVTKKTATIWGITFTVLFLTAFVILETISHRRRRGQSHEHREQFNEATTDAVNAAALGLEHPAPILVAVRNPGSLKMLDRVLTEIDTDVQDVVVITCKVLAPLTQGVTVEERSLQDNDRDVLTRVVLVAEHAGKPIYPLVIPTNNPLYAIAGAARDLGASQVVLGESEKMPADLLAEQFALAWGIAQGENVGEQPVTLRILGQQRDYRFDL